MNRLILGLAVVAFSIQPVMAQDEYDDIYYNPKVGKTNNADSAEKKQKESNYISDFSSMDVDEYNRRGFYYETPVDTIGQTAENSEDFVYTQQIQKYYNPTIVVDNADVLEDILEDSYGNVEIVIENGYPSFASVYSGVYGWLPGYYNWSVRPSWTWSYAWGPFSWTWNYGPSWTWGYAPGWAYYNPWAYRPWGYYPPRPPRPPHHGHHYAYNRPGAYRPVSPRPGWSNNTRPGVNYRGGGSAPRPGSSNFGRPGATSRPSNQSVSNRHSNRVLSNKAQSASGNLVKKEPLQRQNSAVRNRAEKNSSMTTRSSSKINNASVVNSSKRNYNTTTTKRENSNRSYNTTQTNKSSSGSRSNRSYNSSRSTNSHNMNSVRSNSSRSYNSGVSRSGSSRGGGSFGGGHRSGGGSHRGNR